MDAIPTRPTITLSLSLSLSLSLFLSLRGTLQAAIKMQAQYRGHMQARRYNERKAATVIQRHLRGKQARERVKRERASILIQAQYRGSVSRQARTRCWNSPCMRDGIDQVVGYGCNILIYRDCNTQ